MTELFRIRMMILALLAFGLMLLVWPGMLRAQEPPAQIDISGKLEQRQPDGSVFPLANAAFKVVSDNGISYWLYTDLEGKFGWNMYAGIYEVTAVRVNDFFVAFDTGVDFQVDSSHTIHTITLPAANVFGKVNGIHPEDGFTSGAVSIQTIGAPSVFYAFKINEDGSFSGYLAPGNYSIYKMSLSVYNSNNLTVDVADRTITAPMSSGSPVELDVPPVTYKGTIRFLHERTYEENDRIELEYKIVNNPDTLIAPVKPDGTFGLRLEPGSYQLTKLSVNNYNVRDEFVLDDRVVVIPSDPISPMEDVIPVDNTITLKGIITKKSVLGGPAEPFANQPLTLFSRNGSKQYHFNTYTKADGSYSFALPDGEYDFNNMGINSDGVASGFGPVVISARTPVTLDFTIPAVNIKGSVFEETVENAVGPGWVSINKRLSNGVFLSGFSAPIDENGKFNLALPAGSYTINDVLLRSGNGWSSKIINQSFTISDPDQSQALDINLPKQTFQGKITFPDTVEVHEDEYIELMIRKITNSFSYEGSSLRVNADGTFTARLTPGSYEILAVRISNYRPDNRRDDSYYLLDNIIISEGMAEPITRNYDISPMNVLGLVYEESPSNRMGPGYIHIRPANSNQPLNPIRIDAEGRFQTGLPPGEYKVQSVYLEPVDEQTAYKQIALKQSFIITDRNQPYPLDVTIPPVNIRGKITFKDGRVLQGGEYGHLELKDLQVVDGGLPYISLSLNPDGTYEGRLYPGNYELYRVVIGTYSPPFYKYDRFYLDNESLVITSGMQPIVKDIEVHNIPTLIGTVMQKALDGSEAPLAYAELVFHRQLGAVSEHFYVYTDANGKYEAVLPDGTYEITQVRKNNNTLFSGVLATLTISNLSVQTQDLVIPASNLQGKVYEEGSVLPLGPGNVAIYRLEENGNRHFSNFTLHSNGTFSGVLGVGSYIIERVYLASESQDIYLEQPLNITDPGQAANIDVILPKVNFTGTFSFLDGRTIEANESVSLEVKWISALKQKHYRIQVKQDGTFSTRLQPGNYETAQAYIRNTFNNGEVILALDKNTFHIAAGMTVPVVKNMTSNGVNVTGFLFEDVESSKLTSDGYLGITNTLTQQYYHVQFKQGEFRISLPAGEYEISFASTFPSNGGNSETTLLNKKFMITDPAATIEVPVKLPKRNITGTITFADGRTLDTGDSARLVFWNNTLREEAEARVNPDGSYTGRLIPGQYVLKYVGIRDAGTGPEEKLFLESAVFTITEDMPTPAVRNVSTLIANKKMFVFEETRDRPLGNSYIIFERTISGIMVSETIATKPDGTVVLALPAGAYRVTGVSMSLDGNYQQVGLNQSGTITDPAEVQDIDIIVPLQATVEITEPDLNADRIVDSKDVVKAAKTDKRAIKNILDNYGKVK